MSLTVDPLEVLIKAKALLQHGWVSGHEAITAEGKSCMPWDESAVKWCVLGSVRAADYLLDQDNEPINTKYIMSVISISNPAVLSANSYGAYVENENDHSSQQRAIQMVDNAIRHIQKHMPKLIPLDKQPIPQAVYTGNPKYNRS